MSITSNKNLAVLNNLKWMQSNETIDHNVDTPVVGQHRRQLKIEVKTEFSLSRCRMKNSESERGREKAANKKNPDMTSQQKVGLLWESDQKKIGTNVLFIFYLHSPDNPIMQKCFFRIFLQSSLDFLQFERKLEVIFLKMILRSGANPINEI